MKDKVPQSMDNTLLLIGLLGGSLLLGKTSLLLIIILIAIGGFLFCRGKSLKNQGVGLVLRGMGLYVLSFALWACISNVYFLPQWASQMLRAAAVTAGGVCMLRSLLKTDNLGDFHVLNTETMRDEDGNKWEWTN